MVPFETKIACGIDENGRFLLRAYAPVYAGYSFYTTGAILVLDWQVTDAGYQLKNVSVMNEE